MSEAQEWNNAVIALRERINVLQKENKELIESNARLLSSFKKEQDLRFAAEDNLERVKKAVSR